MNLLSFILGLASAWEEATSPEYLRFDDVAPDLKLPPDHAVTTVRTFDGLVAIVKSAIVKDKTRASVEFSFDSRCEVSRKKYAHAAHLPKHGHQD